MDDLIRSNGAFRQMCDFRHMRYARGITPTDIDFFLEFDNDVFVLGELKHKNSELPKGQRTALVNLADCVTPPKRVLLVVAKHQAETNEDIDVANAVVSEYRSRGQWRTLSKPVTVKKLIDEFLNTIGRTDLMGEPDYTDRIAEEGWNMGLKQ